MGLARLKDETDHEFSVYEDLVAKHPWMAFVLVSGIASLAGIPPFAGFIGKLLLFSVAFEAKLHFSLIAMVVGVAISIYYYFGWIREIIFKPRPSFSDETEEKEKDLWVKIPSFSMFKLCMITLAICSLILGI